MALNNGTDLEMGSTLYRNALQAAVAAGLTNEATITAAVARTQRQLFDLGRYDPPSRSTWTRLGAETLNSTAHRALVFEAAVQSLVLLSNQRGHASQAALPLMPGAHIAVVGPQAVGRSTLLSDYYGDEVCWTSDECNGHDCFDCIPTVAEAIERANTGGLTTSAAGVAISGNDTSGIAAALELTEAADVVILVLGIDRSIEHEGIDRTDTALPGEQEEFALQVLALGKPTVVVLINGGALAIDALLDETRAAPYAIVEAFNPNVAGGAPIAAALFGEMNRWGKLPVTMYPHAFMTQKSMVDYNMSSGVGRTYRYYTERPLFPFGHGLSLTTFAINCSTAGGAPQLKPSMLKPSTTLRLRCDVRNTGEREGDEVVMVYHAVGAELRKSLQHPAPQRALIDFARVSVPVGGVVSIPFEVTEAEMKLVNNTGDRVLYKGEHVLEVSADGAGAPGSQAIKVMVS